jgi:hypothetical protein
MKLEDSYHNQRRDRLSDVVGDYLTDESLTAQDFYRDLMAEVQSWINYHEKELKRATEAKELLEGKFEIKIDVPDTITGISSANGKDWNDFWNSVENYSPEQIREFNIKEQAYYDARAKLDAESEQKYTYDKDFIGHEDC